MERSPASDRNCLGNKARDRGHKRVPEPPARTTGTTTEEAGIIVTDEKIDVQSYHYALSMEQWLDDAPGMLFWLIAVVILHD